MNENLRIYIELLDIIERRIDADPSFQGTEELDRIKQTISLLRDDFTATMEATAD